MTKVHSCQCPSMCANAKDKAALRYHDAFSTQRATVNRDESVADMSNITPHRAVNESSAVRKIDAFFHF